MGFAYRAQRSALWPDWVTFVTVGSFIRLAHIPRMPADARVCKEA